MCGIAGIFSWRDRSRQISLGELEDYGVSMAARGPDGFHTWHDPDGTIGLAHRRLAIIDPGPSGDQPMSEATGRYWITFNGQIYNYKSLREEIQSRGYTLQTNSDTEAILCLYDIYGADMPNKLRGMFAFAIWDRKDRTLFAARDPFGIKPFYYSDDGQVFRFASLVKALTATGSVDCTLDPVGQVGFFTLGYVPDPHTYFKAIKSLPAGSSLTVSEGREPVVTSYCDIPKLFAEIEPEEARPGEQIERVRAALDDSLKAHMVSDVPVGSFLSAGFDSTAIVSRSSSIGFDALRTVTLGFEDYRGSNLDETELAEKVARAYGCDHQTKWIARPDFVAEREKLLAAMDQPSIDGVNTYFVSKVTAETGLKVALSGLGADELFGGYPSFAQIPELLNVTRYVPASDWLGKGLRNLTGPVLKHFTSPKYAGLLEYGGDAGGAYFLRRGLFMPWELFDILPDEVVREGWRSLNLRDRLNDTVDAGTSTHAQVSALEMTWYMRGQLLKDSDWAGMGNSLEIRVPYVDLEFLKAVLPIMKSSVPPRKPVLPALCDERMPDEIAQRPKSGFGIPVRDWLIKTAENNSKQNSSERGMRRWAQDIHAELAK